MANGIGWEHKVGKQNINGNGVTNDPSNKTLSASNSHDEFNERIYVSSGELLSAENCFCSKSAVKFPASDIINTKPISIPHTNNMTDTNFTVDDDSQSFETLKKKITVTLN